MKLSELPQLIKERALEVQSLIEDREYLLTNKKELDIQIERQVQSLDPKVYKNENMRDIARFDLRNQEYRDVLLAIARIETALACTKIELQYLRDEFAVAKLELQDAIASA
jgi:hypothetical protein